MQSCNLENISLATAAALYTNTIRPSLLQAPLYAESYGAYAGWRPLFLRIRRDGAEAGLAQILTRRRGVFSDVTLDQGPVWLPSYGTRADHDIFFRTWTNLYPAGLWRRRRVIPAARLEEELPFTAYGLRQKPGSSYATIWYDLENPPALRKNWRSSLMRAQRENIVIEWDWRGHKLEWLLRHEARARAQKNYPGPAPSLLRALASPFIEKEQFLVGRALRAGRPVAGALFILHPPAATYQLAWTGAEGRQCGAQNLLLYEGLRILKQQAIRYLDLGGINDVSARSVGYFKRGLGGEIIHQSGIYR